jgi:hypothetical protein
LKIKQIAKVILDYFIQLKTVVYAPSNKTTLRQKDAALKSLTISIGDLSSREKNKALTKQRHIRNDRIIVKTNNKYTVKK